ncbi:MAG: glycosyltransferase family A protein [Sphingobium sp.]
MSGARPSSEFHPVICVPARNEGKRLPALMEALAAQNYRNALSVIICLNNCTDDSRSSMEAARGRFANRLRIVIDNHEFPPGKAHAGSARRRAMNIGAELLRDRSGGVLLSTDADARPAKNWVEANRAAIAQGADLVGGRILLDADILLPPEMREIHARLDAYWTRVRDIEDVIDPLPWDLPPRHGDHTGASLAITLEAYRAAGGVPPIPSGEDRALVLAAQAKGARLRHAPDVEVRVSAREIGRADGGMADFMKKLRRAVTSGRGPLLPDFPQWAARARWRRELRQGTDDNSLVVKKETLLPPMQETLCLQSDWMAS